jgi:hypothetical protein
MTDVVLRWSMSPYLAIIASAFTADVDRVAVELITRRVIGPDVSRSVPLYQETAQRPSLLILFLITMGTLTMTVTLIADQVPREERSLPTYTMIDTMLYFQTQYQRIYIAVSPASTRV